MVFLFEACKEGRGKIHEKKLEKKGGGAKKREAYGFLWAASKIHTYTHAHTHTPGTKKKKKNSIRE